MTIMLLRHCRQKVACVAQCLYTTREFSNKSHPNASHTHTQHTKSESPEGVIDQRKKLSLNPVT